MAQTWNGFVAGMTVFRQRFEAKLDRTSYGRNQLKELLNETMNEGLIRLGMLKVDSSDATE